MPEKPLDILIDQLRLKAGDQVEQFLLPPPVFTDMQGEIVAVDLQAGTLETRFPLFERYLNPYRTVQGGIIAAAVDNTLGPLSLLVAPPNVTRRLELTYSRPATLEMGYILVGARLLERQDRRLIFSAQVSGPQGERLARVRAEHWIV
jgi:acyl-coenzyme A thioesterase PaaI-like protein